MTIAEWFAEVVRVYEQSLETIRECQEFESLTFTMHPKADDARRTVAGLTPGLVSFVSDAIPLLEEAQVACSQQNADLASRIANLLGEIGFEYEPFE